MTTIPDRFPPLPALRKLADLRDAWPTIFVDTAEQRPLQFVGMPVWSAPVNLRTGDYTCAGASHRWRVERKSTEDLVACCKSGNATSEGNRERFVRELVDLSHWPVAHLLIIGSRRAINEGLYRSEIKPQSVTASIRQWASEHGVRVVIRPTPSAASVWMVEEAWRQAAIGVKPANEIKRWHDRAMQSMASVYEQFNAMARAGAEKKEGAEG